jgi:hypothetical protein
MNKIIKNVAIILVCGFSLYLHAQSPSTIVQGGFCTGKSGAPVPGLLVSLVHSKLGRSTPSYTNQYGYFRMVNIPIHKIPYYLEVYWGKRLILRSKISVQGPLNLPMKCL